MSKVPPDLSKLTPYQVTQFSYLVLPPSTSAMSAIAAMQHASASCVLMVEQEQLVGMLSEREVVQAIAIGLDLQTATIAQLAAQPLVQLRQTEMTDVDRILQLLEQYHLNLLPVVDDHGRLIEVVTLNHILKRLVDLQTQVIQQADELHQMQRTLQHEQEQQLPLYKQVQHLNSSLERQVKVRTAQLQLAYNFEATLKRIMDRVRDSLDEKQILQAAVEELAIAIGTKGCNAAIYDLEAGTSTVCYEYTSVIPYRGRVAKLTDFPEIYDQLLQGQSFQFCSLIPNPTRGRVALLTTPIVDDQQVLGDLWLVNHSFYGFKEEDIRLVEQVANQCAIALRQARLYKAAQAQVQELERLNRLKDDFLSTVSHELRTPMTNIKMATQMLEVSLDLQKRGQERSGSVDRYLGILRDECQREISLINDLLDLSRLEAEPTPLLLANVELKSWFLKTAEPFLERIRNHHQHLQTDFPADLPLLRTDPADLERVLVELLNNACKYTPAGERIAVSAQVTPEHFEIQVANSGVNLPEHELIRLFDKFYRVPNNDPWKHGGTGLGLALVKKLVERMQGSIRVAHPANQLIFQIRLPRRQDRVGDLF